MPYRLNPARYAGRCTRNSATAPATALRVSVCCRVGLRDSISATEASSARISANIRRALRAFRSGMVANIAVNPALTYTPTSEGRGISVNGSLASEASGNTLTQNYAVAALMAGAQPPPPEGVLVRVIHTGASKGAVVYGAALECVRRVVTPFRGYAQNARSPSDTHSGVAG